MDPLPALDADWVRLGWDVLQTLLLAAVALHQWIIARGRVQRSQFQHLENAVEKRIEAQTAQAAEQRRAIAALQARVDSMPKPEQCNATSNRLARLEQAREYAPSDADLKRVHERIDSIAVGLSALKGEMGAVVRLLTTIDQHLRDHPHS